MRKFSAILIYKSKPSISRRFVPSSEKIQECIIRPIFVLRTVSTSSSSNSSKKEQAKRDNESIHHNMGPPKYTLNPILQIQRMFPPSDLESRQTLFRCFDLFGRFGNDEMRIWSLRFSIGGGSSTDGITARIISPSGKVAEGSRQFFPVGRK